uniref:Uncharacterized protein n=1 Tax=Anopheles atroparvus TaxID=41427 RepID=A0A182IJN5_ANOAO
MAAIGWILPNGTTLWQCGGSLIWDNYVLTAAHCTADTENREPNVARFGDLNLYKDDDDQYAQQRKIVEIIRHPDYRFSRKYHDIALMRLETKVSFHETVAPACLWSDDEIRFKKMEATGWGDTGYGEKRSQVLLKVSLSQVDAELCSQHYLNTRGLRSGLHANQICAGDVKMDTCPGDSGGPLEVKLMHNTHFTPFIVGVTSFGTACGLSVPGIYTRVAPYIPWIRSVLNERGENATEGMFLPQVCALRYIQFREYFSDILIAPTTPPTHIRYKGNQTNAVTNYFRHPQYEENSLYNDIGLLKLENRFSFSSSFYPPCLWHAKDVPVEKIELSGRGNKELNELYPELKVKSVSNVTVDVNAVGYTHIGLNCSLQDEYTRRLNKGLTEEHLCFGADPFLVPGTCDQSLGGPIQSKAYHRYRKFTYVYALNLFGKDCGYANWKKGIVVSLAVEVMEYAFKLNTVQR